MVAARIPYVIDNIAYRLADVLNDLLQREHDQQVDIATAYFSIRGFELLRHTLPEVRHFRLLLGDKPLEGEDIGLRPDSAAYLRHELNAEPFTEATLRLVEELIRFLRRSDVAVRLYLGRDPHKSGRNYFLHAKCYLFYGGGSGQSVVLDHLHPVVGIVGSSNFTGPGLVSNRELNLVHKTVLSVQQLRKVLQTYSSTNDVQVLIETVRDLYQHQGAFSSNSSSDTKHVSKIKRDDLNLICYEYIYA